MLHRNMSLVIQAKAFTVAQVKWFSVQGNYNLHVVISSPGSQCFIMSLMRLKRLEFDVAFKAI